MRALEGLVSGEVRAATLAGLRLNGDFAYHRIRTQRQISRIHCGINQAGGRVKGSMNVATALAFAGAATVTAAAIFVVLETVAGDARAILRQDAAYFCEAVF